MTTNRCTRCGGPIVVGPNEPGSDATPAEGYSVDDLDGLCWACLEAVARCGEPAELPREASHAD